MDEKIQNLIGTFCIVNFHYFGINDETFEFNRNILYCKFNWKIQKRGKRYDLIGTFCIVNWFVVDKDLEKNQI